MPPHFAEQFYFTPNKYDYLTTILEKSSLDDCVVAYFKVQKLKCLDNDATCRFLLL